MMSLSCGQGSKGLGSRRKPLLKSKIKKKSLRDFEYGSETNFTIKKADICTRILKRILKVLDQTTDKE